VSYDYGVPASTGNWTGNGQYLSIAEQIVETNPVDPYAVMEAEYRRQMQFTMFQPHLHEQQLADSSGFQPQLQWPHAEMLQDSSLQQVAMRGIGTAESGEWSGSADDVSYCHQWMPTSHQEIVAIPGPRPADVLELNRLVDPQEAVLTALTECWPSTMAVGHCSDEMALRHDTATPAVGSSTPAASKPEVLAAAETGSNREGSALSEVLPSLLSLPAKRNAIASSTRSENRRPANDSVRAERETRVEREARARREEPSRSQQQESDSDSSYEDSRGSARHRYRHKRRGGRAVRERRYGRPEKRRNGRYYDDEDGFLLSSLFFRLKVLFLDVFGVLPRGDYFVRAMRCGMFCAMAWSVKSIIFSSIQLYRSEVAGDELVDNASVAGGVGVG